MDLEHTHDLQKITHRRVSGFLAIRRHCIVSCAKSSLISTSKLCAVASAKSNLFDCASLLTTPEDERNNSIHRGYGTRHTERLVGSHLLKRGAEGPFALAPIEQQGGHTRTEYHAARRLLRPSFLANTCLQVCVWTICVVSAAISAGK